MTLLACAYTLAPWHVCRSSVHGLEVEGFARDTRANCAVCWRVAIWRRFLAESLGKNRIYVERKREMMVTLRKCAQKSAPLESEDAFGFVGAVEACEVVKKEGSDSPVRIHVMKACCSFPGSGRVGLYGIGCFEI